MNHQDTKNTKRKKVEREYSLFIFFENLVFLVSWWFKSFPSPRCAKIRRAFMVSSRFDLAGKTIIVTGAAGLLGRVYVRELAEAGANVVAADLDFRARDKLPKKRKTSREYSRCSSM